MAGVRGVTTGSVSIPDLSSTMTVPPTVASMTRFKGQFVYILFDLLYLQTAQKESPFLGRPTRFFDRS